ncbi:restriction endonuclease subunit S [Streptococcus uberis]|uniref:restriction endonuclease subunit S n=1 Tax=Streptococcus uberis TaxID=1349 RepID=UPI003D786B81
MNKVERLLKKLCPNGVEWEKIDKIFDLKNGYTPSKNNTEFWTNGTIPWFRLEDIRQNGRILDNAIQSVSHNALKGGKVIPANSLILSTTATIGEVALITVPFICNQQLTAISINSEYKNSVNIKFYFYYFQILGNKMKKGISTGSFPIISVSKLKKLKIPIPPLEIQEEIVKILDKFTDYVTELTTELTLRQKQYHYYRDKLLSFEDGEFEVQRKRIGDILVKGKGTKITASQMRLLHKDGSPIRVFAGGKTFADVDYGEIPEKDIHKETAIIVKSRGIIDFEYYSKPFTFKNEFWSYTSNDNNINLRYIYHYLIYNQNHFQEIANKMQMPQISSSDTENFIVPIPKIEIQSRIVQVLDNFDAVCNDLNIGLPKEIKLRQKQYEFFRDKLLTFAAEGVYTDSTVQTRHN